MSTCQEDIKKQHEEARSLLSVMKCMDIVDHGEIPLEWKLHPTEGDPYYSSVEKRGSSNSGSSRNEEKKEQQHFFLTNDDMTCGDVKRVCISSRAERIDVSGLKKLIEPGVHEAYRKEVLRVLNNNSNCSSSEQQDRVYRQMQRMAIVNTRDYWDPIHAAQKNVHVMRPSHDQWGIKKIVLKFCDDFLQRVYEMPWWWQPNSPFASLLRPILNDVLHIPEHRVVRMLLAALPPNTTIPIHHDSGAWVQHTHRVHIPILVDDEQQVLFRCGPTVTSLQRVSCHEGHVFEMNNQAKHAVSNCHPTSYRVHLILDYVDPSHQLLLSHQQHQPLKPGEMILQTRRTMDPLSQAGTRPTPTYLILGVQKSGTTSLYDYLNQHPLIVRARRRETHCLDWRWMDFTTTTTTKKKKKQDIVQLERNHCWKFYFQKELQRHPSLLTGDSTPSYLLDYVRTIPRCQRVFPHLNKFFIMLRDPVSRAYSHYNMVTSLDGTPEQIQVRGTEWLETSFDEAIQIDIQRLHQDGVIPYWNMTTQTVDDKVFQQFINTPQETKAFHTYVSNRIPLNTGSHSLVSRGLYALQLIPWFQSFHNNNNASFCIMELKQFSQQLNRHMERAFQHLQLPPITIEDTTPKNSRSYTKPMNESTKQMLQRFYAPHNQRLQQLLHSKQYQKQLNLITSWDHNPWPYDNNNNNNKSLS